MSVVKVEGEGEMPVSGLVVNNATEKNVKFDWEPAAGAASYKIEVKDANGKVIKTYTSKADYYLVKKMAAGNYSFRVQAIDKNKKAGSWSDDFSFSVADITAPKTGKLTLTQKDADTIILKTSNFSDNVGIAGYKFFLGGQEINLVKTSEGYEYTSENLAGKLTFSVKAYDEKGNLSKGVKSTVTIKDKTPPSDVTNLRVGTADEKTADLAWDAATDNVKEGINYEIKVIDAKGKSKTYKSKTTKLTVKKLAAGNATFQVRAFDKAKNDGAWSEEYKFTVADITAPKTGKLTLTQKDADTIILKTSNFSDNVGIAGYKFFLGGQEINLVKTSEGYEYTSENLAGKLTFSVKAYDEKGNLSKKVKSTVTIKDKTPPSDVTGLTVKAGANAKEAVLTWNAATDNVKDPGNLSYEIWVDGKKKGTSKTLSYTVKNLTAGDHAFEVYAMDKAKNKSDIAAVATFSVAAPVVPGKGLNLTVNTGVKFNEDRWHDEFGGIVPESAKRDKIVGTGGNDTVSVVGDMLCQINGISLGDGDDNVTLQPSANEGWVIIADSETIDMGGGNDTLTCNADTELQAEVINFGAGDDTWEVGVDGDVDFIHAEIDFGEGNDKLYFKEKSHLEYWSNLDLDFGAGDDTLVIDKNADVPLSPFDFYDGNNSNIDFGEGNDSLVLNGTLVLQEPVKGLEKVSGSGQLLINGSDCKKEDFEIFTKARIEVTNVQGGFDEFTDRKSELADNVKSAARAFDDEDDCYYEAEFWLCGEEYAKTEPFGFADEVDYIKFTKTAEIGYFRVYHGNYDNSGALNVQIFKAGTDELLYDEADPEEMDLTQIANGTACYIKLSVKPDSYAHGKITIGPVF